MNEKSLSDLFSGYFPADGQEQSGQQDGFLVVSLKEIASLSGGPLAGAVDEFLAGQGALHVATRSAVSSGGGLTDVITMLTKQFGLPASLSKLIADLLVKILPSVGKTSAETAKPHAKPKPKTKPRPKTKPSASTRPAVKKPKKETASRPKTTAKKPAAKKPVAKKPVGKKRTTEIETGGSD